MKKLLTLFAAAALAASCSKPTPAVGPTGNPQGSADLGSLVIPESFNWSSSFKGYLDVNVTADTAALEVNGEMLMLLDDQNRILERQVVNNSNAKFYLAQPQTNAKTYLYHPNTGTKKEVVQSGNVTFELTSNFFGDIDYQELLNGINNRTTAGKRSAKKGKTSGTEMVVNGDFEVNDFGSYNNNSFSSLSTGKWHAYHQTNRWDRKNINGNHVFESDHNHKGYAYQRITGLNAGDNYTVSANTSGDFCVYLFWYSSNGSYLGWNGWAPNSNDDIFATGTVPNNADRVIVKIHGPKNEWIDNVSLMIDSPIQDDDNDGVDNDNDDYPNDPTKAYQSFYPTSGYQTVAFEDLWPNKGDFDMNDMVLSNQTEYAKNANNEWVDAQFSISLDGVGSGYHNGLAIVFVDGNKQPINQNIIASVSGDATLDQNVTNGIVVFDDVFAAQTNKGGSYYKNNGEAGEPSRSPDVFNFTVTFNSNAGTGTIVPDIYIYRTTDRGLEVHLDGFSGTSAANTSYYNTEDDVQGTYQTSTGLPWAIEIITPNKSYMHPTEKTDILIAYPQFQGWAESSGSQNQTWLDNPVTNVVIDVSTL